MFLQTPPVFSETFQKMAQKKAVKFSNKMESNTLQQKGTMRTRNKS